MPITVPNPYGVDVAGTRPGVVDGLTGAPETGLETNALVGNVTAAASDFDKAMQKWQFEIDKTRVQDAANQLNSAALSLKYGDGAGHGGWVNELGRNALERKSGKSLEQENQESFKSSFDEIRKGLGNGRQRAMLDEVYNGLYATMSQDISAHVTKQFDVYQSEVDQQSLDQTFQMGASTDPTLRRSAVETSRALVKRIYERRGLPVDYSKGPGVIHAMSIENMVDDGRASLARQYLDQNIGEMSATQIERANRIISIGEEQEQVANSTDSILSQFPTDRRKGMAAANRLPSKIRAKVKTGLRSHYAEVDRVERENVREQTEAAWSYIYETRKMPPPSYLDGLPARTLLTMESKVNSFSKASGSSGTAALAAKKLKDPIGAAVDQGDFGFVGITDWAKAGPELRKRSELASAVKDEYGYSGYGRVLSTQEATSLKATLGAMDPQAQMNLVGSLVSSLGEQGSIDLAQQLGDEWRNVVLLKADPDLEQQGAARLYMIGRQGLRENQPQLKTVNDGTLGVPAMAARLNGLYEDPRVRDAVLDSVKNVAAGLAMTSGEAANSDHLSKAFKMMVGDVYQYHGGQVPLKDGLTESDLEETVRRLRASYESSAKPVARLANGRTLSGSQMSQLLATGRIRPAMSGNTNAFNVLASDSTIVYDMDGKPLEFTVLDVGAPGFLEGVGQWLRGGD